MSPEIVKLAECAVVLASPEPYQECVVLVETPDDLIFILTDESRDGKCIVEMLDRAERILRRISLSDLRSLLDAAERRLVGSGR